MKRICIHQPDFAPYLGFFHRLLVSDVYIVFDDVQFIRRGWHHRDKIKTRSGAAWLSLSIKKADYHTTINIIELAADFDAWVPSVLNLISENYKTAPYFDHYFPIIDGIFKTSPNRLIDLNMAFLNLFFQELDIDVDIQFSSKIDAPGNSSEKLLNLVQAVGGTHYITGTGSRDYIDDALFDRAGIQLEIQPFPELTYPQLFGDFAPNLSCIDGLMNCGPALKDLLRKC